VEFGIKKKSHLKKEETVLKKVLKEGGLQPEIARMIAEMIQKKKKSRPKPQGSERKRIELARRSRQRQ